MANSDSKAQANSDESVSVNKIVRIIDKSFQKNITKEQITKFLKKKDFSQDKIDKGFEKYYETKNNYKISFSTKSLGFKVINDPNNENAIVSSIQDNENIKSGLMIGSRVLKLNNIDVEGLPHSKILEKIFELRENPPLIILFRAPQNRVNNDGSTTLDPDIEQVNFHNSSKLEKSKQENDDSKDNSDNDTNKGKSGHARSGTQV